MGPKRAFVLPVDWRAIVKPEIASALAHIEFPVAEIANMYFSYRAAGYPHPTTDNMFVDLADFVHTTMEAIYEPADDQDAPIYGYSNYLELVGSMSGVVLNAVYDFGCGVAADFDITAMTVPTPQPDCPPYRAGSAQPMGTSGVLVEFEPLLTSVPQPAVVASPIYQPITQPPANPDAYRQALLKARAY